MLHIALLGETEWKYKHINDYIIEIFPLPHSGPGVLLEGKLLDVSRHAITDVSGQKVSVRFLTLALYVSSPTRRVH